MVPQIERFEHMTIGIDDIVGATHQRFPRFESLTFHHEGDEGFTKDTKNEISLRDLCETFAPFVVNVFFQFRP
jgi:hypothetical protein